MGMPDLKQDVCFIESYSVGTCARPGRIAGGWLAS